MRRSSLNESDKRPISGENSPRQTSWDPLTGIDRRRIICNLKERYARNNLAADQWLQANIGSSGLNVTGAWEAEESGWGAIRFEQSGSRVSGAMGNYSREELSVVRGCSSP
jgi:hypothetical protein